MTFQELLSLAFELEMHKMQTQSRNVIDCIHQVSIILWDGNPARDYTSRDLIDRLDNRKCVNIKLFMTSRSGKTQERVKATQTLDKKIINH